MTTGVKKTVAGIAALAALALGGAALAQAGGGSSNEPVPAAQPPPASQATPANEAGEAEDRDEPGDVDSAAEEASEGNESQDD